LNAAAPIPNRPLRSLPLIPGFKRLAGGAADSDPETTRSKEHDCDQQQRYCPDSGPAGNFRTLTKTGYRLYDAVTAPMIASATPFTSTMMLPITVYLKSGSTAPTLLMINGVTPTVLPLTSQIASILPGACRTVQTTYTVAPTGRWVGG
jgi:hypothetical protein